jgi:hypothetical protein
MMVKCPPKPQTMDGSPDADKMLDSWLAFRENIAAQLLFNDCLKKFEGASRRNAITNMFGGATVVKTTTSYVPVKAKPTNEVITKPAVQMTMSSFLLDSMIVGNIKKKERAAAVAAKKKMKEQIDSDNDSDNDLDSDLINKSNNSSSNKKANIDEIDYDELPEPKSDSKSEPKEITRVIRTRSKSGLLPKKVENKLTITKSKQTQPIKKNNSVKRKIDYDSDNEEDEEEEKEVMVPKKIQKEETNQIISKKKDGKFISFIFKGCTFNNCTISL